MPALTREECIPLLDKLFPFIPEHDYFNIMEVCITAKLPGPDGANAWDNRGHIRSLLYKFDYIEIAQAATRDLLLTEIGRAAKKMGGHATYQDYLTKKSDQKDESDRLEYLSKKYFYKSRYWPHFFALAGFVMGIISLAKDCNSESTQMQKKQNTETTTPATSSKIDTAAKPPLRIDSVK